MTQATTNYVVRQVTGVVTQANAGREGSRGGFKLKGHEDFLNISRYAGEGVAPPAAGDAVRVGLDGRGYVRELVVLHRDGPGLPTPAAAAVVRSGPRPAPEPVQQQLNPTQKIALLAVAMQLAPHDGRSQDYGIGELVITIAQELESWVLS